MMRRVCFVAAWLLVATAAGADAISDQVVKNLRAQGFDVVQMDRTWLGRMWILARNDTLQREVVFNPATGEILRDYAVLLTALNRPEDNGSDHDGSSAPQTAMADPVMGDDPPALMGAMPPPLGGATFVAPVEPAPPVQ